MMRAEFMSTTPRELAAMFRVVSDGKQREIDRWATQQAAFYNASFQHPKGKKAQWSPQDFGASKTEVTPEQQKAISLAGLLASKMAFGQDRSTLPRWATSSLKPKQQKPAQHPRSAKPERRKQNA